MATSEKILLGTGVFSIGGTPVALTRGGGVWEVQREFRNIEADGDRGSVEGRVEIDTEKPFLTVRKLDPITPEGMLKYYPGLSNTTGTVTGTLVIAAGDYVDITWVGKTKDGKAVTINVTNALNKNSINWNLEDKSEVVEELNFEGHYAEATRSTPPWSIVFAA